MGNKVGPPAKEQRNRGIQKDASLFIARLEVSTTTKKKTTNKKPNKLGEGW